MKITAKFQLHITFERIETKTQKIQLISYFTINYFKYENSYQLCLWMLEACNCLILISYDVLKLI